MFTEEWNPTRPDDAAYLGYLNRTFGGSWTDALMRWYMMRPFAGTSPDRLVIFDQGRPVAGSVVNYRKLHHPQQGTIDVGIATGSWTLPKARRQGLFSRSMNASARRAAERECALFIAFVTADNPSSRALQRCGAVMIPASYMVAELAGEVEAAPAAKAVSDTPASRPDPTVLAFCYPDADSFRGQILDRPSKTTVYQIGAHAAVVEQVGKFDRLQWTSAPPAARGVIASGLAGMAARSGRSFFMYGTGGWTQDCAARARLAARPGFIACLDATTTARRLRITQLDWDIQSGDRM